MARAITTTMPEYPALLRLLQLASPTLPVGAYAYSQGLEYAVQRGWVTNETETRTWILGLLGHSQTYLDIPVFARLYRSWLGADDGSLQYWNAWLYASREAAELQREDRHLGTALARVLTALEIVEAESWQNASKTCFATLFSLAAVRWRIELPVAATGYLWAWCENQVAAAAKLALLGQTAAQRILSSAMPAIATAVDTGLSLDDNEIGCAVAGLGLASALHENQYSRLFRS